MRSVALLMSSEAPTQLWRCPLNRLSARTPREKHDGLGLEKAFDAAFVIDLRVEALVVVVLLPIRATSDVPHARPRVVLGVTQRPFLDVRDDRDANQARWEPLPQADDRVTCLVVCGG